MGSTPLLRQYFPKGTDLSIYSPADLARVENELNNRPRLVLGDATPEQLFTQMLALTNYQICNDRLKPPN